MGGFGSFFKVTFKTFADVPSWINYQGIKSHTQFLWQGIKPAFRTIKRQAGSKSFDEVVQQNSLSEDDLKERARYCLKYFFVYLLGLIFCTSYALYLFFDRHLIAGVIAILITLVFFFHALSMHFFYFEIKNRKLGCTLREWLSGQINNDTAQ